MEAGIATASNQRSQLMEAVVLHASVNPLTEAGALGCPPSLMVLKEIKKVRESPIEPAVVASTLPHLGR